MIYFNYRTKTARSRTMHARRRGRQLHHVRPRHIRGQAQQQSLLTVLAASHRTGAEYEGAQSQGLLYGYVNASQHMTPTRVFAAQQHINDTLHLCQQNRKSPSAATASSIPASNATAAGRTTARTPAAFQCPAIPMRPNGRAR